MAYVVEAETEAVNADSFLDIVASVVSVMIIMVMVTGLKIKNTPITSGPAPETAHALQDLKMERAREETLRGDVLKLAAEVQTVQKQALVRAQERNRIAALLAATEQRTQGERRAIEGQSQQSQELALRLSELQNQVAEVDHQCVVVESAPTPPITVESYPTPIGRTVDGREVHFQLRNGRLTYLPLDVLSQSFQADARRNLDKLRDQAELTETMEPESGFRIRYTIERHEVTPEESGRTGRAGAYVRVKLVEFLPISDDLGEAVDEALGDGSQFHMILADRRNRDATVTVWVYPESFEAFRKVKQDLYRLGFPVAARPLPEGVPIGASPEGSKSTAE